MDMILSKDSCSKHGVTPEEMLYLLFLNSGKAPEEVVSSLLKKSLISIDRTGLFPKAVPTADGNALFNEIIAEGTVKKELVEEDKLEQLALSLKELFPEGKKEGTHYYWRGNTSDIKRRLKSFFLFYGDKWTAEDMIAATKAYVQSFNGSTGYMRILPYFLWKVKVENGKQEIHSDLADYMENKGQKSSEDSEWTANLK